jgi:DNA-binding PadR family transcriptional regulator
VYGTLDRLEKKGWVRSWHTEPDPVRGGHPRRFFDVSKEGHKVLSEAQKMFERMWNGVELAVDEG